MTFQLEKTPWLPPAPADFSLRCKALAGAENGGALAASLASFALTANQCATFARALKKARATTPQMPPLSNFRLGVLASFTADLLLDCVPAACARHGVLVDLVTTPYDQIFQQALDPQSIVNCAQADGRPQSRDEQRRVVAPEFRIPATQNVHGGAQLACEILQAPGRVRLRQERGDDVQRGLALAPVAQFLGVKYTRRRVLGMLAQMSFENGFHQGVVAKLREKLRAQQTGVGGVGLFSETLLDQRGAVFGAARPRQPSQPVAQGDKIIRKAQMRLRPKLQHPLSAARLFHDERMGEAERRRVGPEGHQFANALRRSAGGGGVVRAVYQPETFLLHRQWRRFVAIFHYRGGLGHQLQKQSDFRDRSGEEFARTAPGAPARDYATDLS